MAHIAYFLLAWVARNHFVNTNFSKLSEEIADPNHYQIQTNAKKSENFADVMCTRPKERGE